MSTASRLAVIVLFLFIAFTAMGQNALAQQLSISGSVSDGFGAVPGAAVTLRDPAGMTMQIMSNDSGQYRFDGLRPGAYEITVIREGFANATRALTLVGESRTVNVTLEVVGLVTSIDVTDVAGRSTAAGMDIPNRELPTYVASVSSRTLQEQGINDLPAALENISGVMTQVQYGVYEWYTIGGISQQSGNDFLYVDGMTLTGNRSMTQLNNIEEVQVLKGPNSILYGGSGAGQGGMVNLIRKKPQATRVSDIQYRIGAFGLQEVTTGTAGPVLGLERLLYRVDSSFSHRDGWRQTGSNRFNVSPSITWLINNKMRITANEALIRDRYSLDAGLRAELVNRPGVPFDKKMNPEGDFQLTRDWQNQLVYSYNVTNRLTFTETFFSNKKRDQYLDAESMTYNATLDQVNRSYLYFQHNRRPIQNLTEVTGDYSPAGIRNRFMVRYDYSKQHNYSNRTGTTPGANSAAHLTLPPVPVNDFIAGTWVDTAPVYTDFPITRVDFSTNRYHALVFQDQVNPVKWLGTNFTISLRRYRRLTHNDVYDNGNFVSAGNDVRLFNNTLPNYRAGAAFIPQEHWPRLIRGIQPYFSYNSSFNPVNQLQPDGTPLDPVINKSLEVGNKWQGLNSRLNVLTAFRRIRDKNRIVNICAGCPVEQIGTSSTYNGDLDIQGEVGGGLTVIANYSYADSKIDALRADGAPQTNAGRRFPHAPKHQSRVWLTKSFRAGENTRLTASLGARYVYRYFANAANTMMVPTRSTMDGAVSFRRPKYDITLNLDNLTNKKHYFVSQINGGGLLYPGPPLNARVTIGYRFQ